MARLLGRLQRLLGLLPVLAAGNILVSDRSTGLYIVRPSGAAFTNYGQGCACSANQPCPSLNANGGTLSNSTGGGALTPSLGNAGLPILNSSYTVTVDGSIPATLAVIVSGLSDSIYTGSPLPVALPGSPGCSVYAAPQVLDLHITNAAGTADASFNIPGSPGLIGIEVFHQWAVWDPTINSLGIVMSDAGRATIDT